MSGLRKKSSIGNSGGIAASARPAGIAASISAAKSNNLICKNSPLYYEVYLILSCYAGSNTESKTKYQRVPLVRLNIHAKIYLGHAIIGLSMNMRLKILCAARFRQAKPEM